MLILIN